MNLVLIEKEEIHQNQVIFSDRRAAHIVKVLKSNVGDSLKVGEIDGRLGLGIVTSITKKKPFSVTVDVAFSTISRAKSRIDLILALPRPIMLRRILSQVTALGVGTIHLIHASRVEKSFWEASLLEVENYREHLLAGLEQCGDTRLPQVTFHKRFKPFVEDYLPAQIDKYTAAIVAHPEGDRSLQTVLCQNKNEGRVLLAIGPEGGWVDYEITKFNDIQFSACTIGDRILKVDTAVIALHGYVSALLDANKD